MIYNIPKEPAGPVWDCDGELYEHAPVAAYDPWAEEGTN